MCDLRWESSQPVSTWGLEQQRTCAARGHSGAAAADICKSLCTGIFQEGCWWCSSPKLISEGAFCTVIVGKNKVYSVFLLPGSHVRCRLKRGRVCSWEIPSMALKAANVSFTLWGISNLSSLDYVVKPRAGTGIPIKCGQLAVHVFLPLKWG